MKNSDDERRFKEPLSHSLQAPVNQLTEAASFPRFFQSD